MNHNLYYNSYAHPEIDGNPKDNFFVFAECPDSLIQNKDNKKFPIFLREG
jgi:hypothetical protein